MSGDAQAVLKNINQFDKSSLQHVEPQEKVVLPAEEDIKREKTEKQLMEEIIQPPQLKHAETQERNTLPTKEDILEEKTK